MVITTNATFPSRGVFGVPVCTPSLKLRPFYYLQTMTLGEYFLFLERTQGPTKTKGGLFLKVLILVLFISRFYDLRQTSLFHFYIRIVNLTHK